MNPVKEETPIAPVISADQSLVEKTGGEPGIANLEHPKQVRDEIEKNTGSNATPENEIAEKGLEETGKAGFLKDVVGVQEESEAGQAGITDSSSVLGDLGKNVGNLLPEIGEYDNVQTASSKGANEVELKRQKQMKAV